MADKKFTKEWIFANYTTESWNEMYKKAENDKADELAVEYNTLYITTNDSINTNYNTMYKLVETGSEITDSETKAAVEAWNAGRFSSSSSSGYVIDQTDGHRYSEEWSYDETQHWHQCIDSGFKYLKKDLEAHDLDEEEIYVPPTETEDGYIGHYCKICDHIVISSHIPALNNFIFTLLNNDTYEIKGNNTSLSGNIILPKEYNNKPVTSIGLNAFDNCSFLTSLVIPNSVTSIEDYAFYQCTSITSITIPNGVTSIGSYAFSYCSSIASIVIPDSVTKISTRAFFRCSSLTSITLPFVGGSATSNRFLGYIFGARAYSENNSYVPSSLKEVIISDNCTSIDTTAFRECTSLTSIKIPNSVTKIGSQAFYNCSSLTSITLPFIGYSATSKQFLGYLFGASSYYENDSCVPSSLKEIIIGDNCTSIADRAFLRCSSLTSIIIPDGLTSIGDSAFRGCTSLTSIVLPDSVTSIGPDAFHDCTSLTSITIPDSVTSIGSSAFYNCSSLQYNEYDNAYYLGNDTNPYVCLVKAKSENITSCQINESSHLIGDSAFRGCTSLTSITIPDSVTSIGPDAFHDCTSIASIVLPDSVTSIGGSAFYGCSSLTSITIPNSVTSIRGYAFRDCTSLTSIVLPNSVTSIGSCAFMDCTSLASITIPNSIISIYINTFTRCTSLAEFNYSGTVSEWESVTLGNNWKSGAPFTVIHCSDGDIQL